MFSCVVGSCAVRPVRSLTSCVVCEKLGMTPASLQNCLLFVTDYVHCFYGQNFQVGQVMEVFHLGGIRISSMLVADYAVVLAV